MPYKLISLVILLFFLIINKAYSENEFILPVKKPSIFKKIKKDTLETTNNLPQKKLKFLILVILINLTVILTLR